jgi:peptide/nickel transport system substrate-binding protein
MFKLSIAISIVFCLFASLLVLPIMAESKKVEEVMPGVPRYQTLILEDPTGRVLDPENFNRWSPGSSTYSTGLQQGALDTLWYIDPDRGIEGVWDNALAKERPIYNEDFTKMTVKLREGIYWSDGVEFTADDVVFTVKTLMGQPAMEYGTAFQSNVDKVYKTDDYTVVFELRRPNSRFHSYFTVRWSACYIMPKHVFEKVEDPLSFNFNPPVSLGAYILKDYDKNGYWFLWERREDWERTSIAKFGEPGPKYLLYKDPGPPEKRVIAQANHELDVIHDVTPEGAISLLKKNPYTRSWFDGFPWAHPDPTLPSVMLNHEKYPLGMRDVRWALTLATDIVNVAMASYIGAATISAIQIPPTGMHPEMYFEPVQEWLKNYTLEVNGEEFHPYDPDAAIRIAEKARETLPEDISEQVPTDPEVIKERIGYGWWKYAPEVAEKLLERNGFKRDSNGKWLLPNGEPWKITINTEGPQRPTMTRAGAEIAEEWREFGIDAHTAERKTKWDLFNYGKFEGDMGWTIETWGGHPDLSWAIETMHSDYYVPSEEPCNTHNDIRYKSEELDSIIEELRTIPFSDTEAIVENGIRFIKLTVDDMITIPLMSYNVFTMVDEYYWTNYPTAGNPYTNPVPNWGNTKYMFPLLKPTGRK